MTKLKLGNARVEVPMDRHGNPQVDIIEAHHAMTTDELGVWLLNRPRSIPILIWSDAEERYVSLDKKSMKLTQVEGQEVLLLREEGQAGPASLD